MAPDVSHYPPAAADPAAEICQRMAQIRSALGEHAVTAAKEARRTTDWRSYVTRNPWAWAAAAAAVGYLLIPRRPKLVMDQRAVQHVAQDVAREMRSMQQAQPTGVKYWLGLALPIVQGIALRGAMSFVDKALRSRHEDFSGPPHSSRRRQPR